MEGKTSIVKLLGLPDPFAVIVLTFSFILLLAPYFSGADFGLFKIPQFTNAARRKLKIIGPIVFLGFAILFVPMISQHIPSANRYSSNNALSPSNSNLSTPPDVHNEIQQHLASARNLYDKAQYEEALKECDKALALEPDNEATLNLKQQINKTREILNKNQ